MDANVILDATAPRDRELEEEAFAQVAPLPGSDDMKVAVALRVIRKVKQQRRKQRAGLR